MTCKHELDVAKWKRSEEWRQSASDQAKARKAFKTHCRNIATELFVSVGTVKTHINNLYRKLEAHTRTQAVARARELNLF